MVAAVVCNGCSRASYRNQADQQTYPIIEDRATAPGASVGRTLIDTPPESRFYDPFSPDYSPQPPDDAVAAYHMANPGGIRGSRKWGQYGTAGFIEQPGWESTLGLDEKGVLNLTQERAMELALVNSREYQSALEDVYLSALGLTLNRFEFATRWFSTNAARYDHVGSSSTPGETNTLTVNRDKGFNRTFAAGGQLLVDFANSYVWEFTGNTHVATGGLSATLVQPLLRNFGRQVRLESLTQAERDVLYAVRDLARFRKQFWASVAVQGNGYLNLLQSLQELRNAKVNLRSQEENLRLHEELFKAGKVSVVEVDRAIQEQQRGRLSVFSAEITYQNQLDAYKLTLGLPPRIPVELDDSLLAPFTLSDPKHDLLRDEVEAFQKARFKELDQLPSVVTLRESYAWLKALAERAPAVLEAAEKNLGQWERETSVDAEAGKKRRKEIDNLRDELANTRKTLAELNETLTLAQSNIDDSTRKIAWETVLKLTQTLLNVLDTGTTTQAHARIQLIKLPEFTMKEDDAIGYAKDNRLDFQNSLARVTDSWRKVTVAANALKSDLNITASGTLGSDPDRKFPLDFSAEASRLSVGVQFDSPLNRQAERNVYRASQVNYQRSRRNYMALSDQIEFAIRRDLRALSLQRTSFEVARQTLISATRQVEAARVRILDNKQSAGTSSTLDILNALSAQLAARNALSASFIAYEQQRIQLLLDLEALQLDDRGFPREDSLRPPIISTKSE